MPYCRVPLYVFFRGGKRRWLMIISFISDKKNEKNPKSSNLCTFQISAKSDHIWMSYRSFNFSAKISKNCFSLIKAKILNILDNIENIICSRDYPASFWWKLAMSENKWMSLLKPKKSTKLSKKCQILNLLQMIGFCNDLAEIKW